MKTRFCCFISVFFSSLDEVSDLEGVLKHSIFQGILIYQKKQLAFRFGVWAKAPNATSNGWVVPSRSILRSCKVFFGPFFWIEQREFITFRGFFGHFLTCTQQSWDCVCFYKYHETVFTCLLLFFIGHGQEKVYQDNIEASVAVLKKLSDDWREQATKLSHEPLREILKNLRQKVVSHSSVCMTYFLFIALT